MKVNEKIKKIRTESGITQSSLANYLGITQAYVSKLESDERELTVDLLTKIANLFVCSIEDLLDETKKVRPMALPFRKASYTVDDLSNISDANRIILNLTEMIDIIEG